MLAMQIESINWAELGAAAGVVFVVMIFLFFLTKALPIYRDIKNREFDVRTEEARVSGQVSTALLQSATATGQLAGAIELLGGTLNHIAVEQRKTTDNLLILQRVNTDQTDSLTESVDQLADRMSSMEETIKENGIYGTPRPKAVAPRKG